MRSNINIKLITLLFIACFSVPLYCWCIQAEAVNISLQQENRASQQNKQINIEKYLSVIGVQNDIALSPSIETLRLVVNKHVMSIPYQNFDIYFHNGRILNLSSEALQQKLLDQRRGGGCYETSELLYNALVVLGFDVKRIPVFPLNNKPFNPLIPSSHNILLVIINNKFFLIDVGYGNNSLRYPVEFSFEKTEEQEAYPGEIYQLVCNDNYYQLNLKIKGEWASLYRFDRPLNFIDLEQTVRNVQNMMACPERLPIRDVYIKASILIEDGRVGFYLEPKQPISSAYKLYIKAGKENKKLYNSYEEFAGDIFYDTGLLAPEELRN